jgi:cytochrome P450
LLDADYWQDPHSVLRAAREQHPIGFASTGEPVVLRYADVEALASNPRTISNALSIVERHVSTGPLVEWWRRMLTNLNGPAHDRLRGLVPRAFTPRSVEAKRPRMRELTREILARHADTGELDVLHDFANELPIRLICEVLGVPAEHHDDFSRWSTDLGSALTTVLTPELQSAGEAAATNMNRAVLDLLAARRVAPRDDLLSALIRAADELDERFDDEDLLVLVINIIFGSHDSSRSMLAVAVALLLAHPEQLALLRGDRGLAKRAAEELLRFEPLIPVMAREPLEDLEIAGVKIAAGQPYLLSILSANRDASVFADPDRLDITRSGPRSFSFGWGAHFCLGSSLARAEFEEVIPEFFDCCRNVELQIDEPRWVPFANLRRIERLPIRFEPGRFSLSSAPRPIAP